MFDLRLSNGFLKKLIFKGNDDVRIDSLVLQMIQIIDLILLEKNIDLKFTNYAVFPINSKRGLIEYVESSTLSQIKQDYNTLENYFKLVAEKNKYSMQELLDNYTKSVGKYFLLFSTKITLLLINQEF
ncbi:MAG: Phosphatidylinositol 3-kinase catalytic subunit type 3 [Marteilia pararefringens]